MRSIEGEGDRVGTRLVHPLRQGKRQSPGWPLRRKDLNEASAIDEGWSDDASVSLAIQFAIQQIGGPHASKRVWITGSTLTAAIVRQTDVGLNRIVEAETVPIKETDTNSSRNGNIPKICTE
jgi:hypothetical protein